VEFDPERLKHTLGAMRKFTGRQLLDHAAAHLPKSFTREFQKACWQRSRAPVLATDATSGGITSNGFWKQKMDYIDAKPCRKGLVPRPEGWRFSSARFWLTKEPNDVQLSDVGWE